MESARLSSGGSSICEESVAIVAADACVIRGTHYFLEAEGSPTCAVVLNSGAGIAAIRYQHFARYLAKSGIPVLSYDYRGIGLSKPRSLRKFRATIEDWAEYDCRAAINWLKARYESSHVFGIGHSIGALFFGGAANVDQLAGIIMISAHTGYYGDYRKAYRLPMALLWHGVMPALTLIFGFFPGRSLRLGDDIPKGVAMQWARRRTPTLGIGGVKAPADRLQMLVQRFSRSDLETLMVTIADDSFATEAATARIQQMFPNLRVKRWVITPAQVGLNRLGHFGFFRRAAAPALWRPIVDYLRFAVLGSAQSNLRALIDDSRDLDVCHGTIDVKGPD